MRDLKRWMVLSLAVVAAAAGVAACGGSSSTTSSSSSSKASSSSSSPSAKSTAHGTPIKIGVIASGTGVTAEPWVGQAAQVGANAVNAAGGINGHPIQVDYCDDQGSVQTAAVCAQKVLVQDHALMLVGDDGTYDTGVTPVLASAHTILFSPEGASLSDYQSTNVFMMEPEIAAFNVMPQLLPAGHHNVADFTADIAVAVKDAQVSIPAYKAAGDTMKVITVPLTASDFSTPCLQAKNMHADIGIVEFNGLTQFGPMAQACSQLGVNLTWVVEGSEISPAVLQAASNLHLKTIVDLPYTSKAYQGLIADSAKYGPKISSPYNDSAIQAYVGMKLLPEVLKGAGTTTDAQKIKSYLASQTAFNTEGYAGTINFTSANHPFGTSLFGIKNTCVYKFQAQGTGAVQTSTAPFCLKTS